MKNMKCFSMLLVVVGLITATVGVILPIHKAKQVRAMTREMLTHWHAHEREGGKESLQEYLNTGALRDQTENQLRRLADRSHSTALVGLLLTACGLTGLWAGTNREIKVMQGTHPLPGGDA